MEKQRETLIASSTSTSGLNSSNIGFQLLKKHGWKEGSGLGISQQGRLEPVETYVKNNKRGLGADKLSATTSTSTNIRPSQNNQPTEKKTKKEKAMSKRMKKMRDEEKSWQDKEFERSFFREFWPDNV